MVAGPVLGKPPTTVLSYWPYFLKNVNSMPHNQFPVIAMKYHSKVHVVYGAGGVAVCRTCLASVRPLVSFPASHKNVLGPGKGAIACMQDAQVQSIKHGWVTHLVVFRGYSGSALRNQSWWCLRCHMGCVIEHQVHARHPPYLYYLFSPSKEKQLK